MKDAQDRKDTPVYSGVFKYFPLALQEIARVSKAGNDQHNPGKPLFWDRSKSGDELDALARHLLEAGTFDTDGQRHSAKLAWRGLSNLQKELEMQIIKPTKTDSNWYLNFGDNAFIHSINDWGQIIGRYNWYNFHFIHLYIENDVMTGGLEIECVVLGIGFRFRWNYNDKVKKLVKKARKRAGK